MPVSQSVYNHMPQFAQSAVVNVYGIYQKHMRYGSVYKNHFEFLHRFESLPPEKQMSYQLNALRELIQYSKTQSHFYKDLYKDINVTDIRSLADIKHLPILTKEMIRENQNEIYCRTKGNRLRASRTSGTTGTPLKFLHTKYDSEKRMAVLDYFRLKVGFINMKMRKASFNSRPVAGNDAHGGIARTNYAMKQRLYSVFHINEEYLPAIINDMNHFRPSALEGYPSAISEISKYIIRTNSQIIFKLTAIFPTAETLTTETRAIIERAFNCKVFNQYGSSEGAPIITECAFGKLHLETSTGIIETLPNTDEVLVTGFLTHGTPIIRYKIGDCIIPDDTWDEPPCACGSRLPQIRSIEGRTTDFIYAISGAKIPAVSIGSIIRKDTKGIINSQIIQHERKSITICIVKDSSYSSEHEFALKNNLQQFLGNEMNIIFQYVNKLEKTAGGKVRFIINTLGD